MRLKSLDLYLNIPIIFATRYLKVKTKYQSVANVRNYLGLNLKVYDTPYKSSKKQKKIIFQNISSLNLLCEMVLISRGFNGSVKISESCNFQSQFDPLYIIF